MTLSNWLSEMLDEVYNEKNMSIVEISEQTQMIYNVCLQEIIAQVTVQCSERGQLLERIWEAYQGLFDKAIRVTIAEKKQTEKYYAEKMSKLKYNYDKEVESITVSLTSAVQDRDINIQKFERKKAKHRFLKNRMVKIDQEQTMYEEETNRLRIQVQKLKEEVFKLQRDFPPSPSSRAEIPNENPLNFTIKSGALISQRAQTMSPNLVKGSTPIPTEPAEKSEIQQDKLIEEQSQQDIIHAVVDEIPLDQATTAEVTEAESLKKLENLNTVIERKDISVQVDIKTIVEKKISTRTLKPPLNKDSTKEGAEPSGPESFLGSGRTLSDNLSPNSEIKPTELDDEKEEDTLACVLNALDKLQRESLEELKKEVDVRLHQSLVLKDNKKTKQPKGLLSPQAKKKSQKGNHHGGVKGSPKNR